MNTSETNNPGSADEKEVLALLNCAVVGQAQTKGINYARLNNLDEVLFPVEEHPIYVSVAGNGAERRVAVPGKKAIINSDTQRVLGIVGRSYRLVANDEALDMAHECCRVVFPDTKPGEWEVKTVDAPFTAGYCHIDLVHNTTALDFSFVAPEQRPEVFGPFIRVTNSFNGLRALGFDIGFYRKVCKNGMILRDTLIRVRFNHQRRVIGERIRFNIYQERLTEVRAAFTTSLGGLRDCAVPRAQFEPLIRGVLALRPPEPLTPDSHEAKDWQKLGAHLKEIGGRYADELGDNAYAVFNAVTEFASHPLENRCVHRDRHGLQRLAGVWLASFNESCRKPGFSIFSHADQLAKERTENQNRKN